MDTAAKSIDDRDLQIEDLQASYASLSCEHTSLQHRYDEAKRQLDWFKRELFGPKSERREIHPDQLALFESMLENLPPAPEQETEVPAHIRRKKRHGDEVNDTGLRFTDEVPLETKELSVPELEGPDADQYSIIGYTESYRLASEPGTHVVICYKRPVIARKDGSGVVEAPAPVGPLGHATADVSFLAQMLMDKFAYHCPLYRQHQKLQHEGITIARASLDNWTHSAIVLLKPIADAVMNSVLSGDHIKIDETPIKAGKGKTKQGQGKMKQAWFWPILGESGDLAFHFSPSRGKQVLVELLDNRFTGTIQTDGYGVYARYAAERKAITHALCWAHTRRAILKAEASEPQAAGELLAMIATLYEIEKQLRESHASDEAILERRKDESQVCVDKIFEWIKARRNDPGLLPKSPLASALNYAAEREAGLRVFLDDAWLALDTNDIERGLRVIPMGKKNWMFCSSEVGAEHVAIIQTLLATCKAHGINGYHYLVDVLQRIDQHPASKVDELTPREWQKRFGDNPLKSPLHEIRKTV